MRIFIIIIFFINSATVVFCQYIHKNKKNIVVINTRESKNSFISYVIVDGVKYILKQKKDATKYLSVVRDALAAYIAQDLAVAHSVKIISSKESFPGKKYAKAAGVILTIALGKSVRGQPSSRYYNLCLKQRKPDENLLPHRWLNETIIHQITWHKQLPIIIALDLFLCNTDRHGGNLFYDSETDTFCAIDMDNIYRRDLPMLAYEKLQLMIEGKKQFTNQEIEALISVKNTLQFLLNRYTSKEIIQKLHFFVKQADFSQEIMRSKKMIKKITRHEKMIAQTRLSLYRLIDILNKIIVGA